MPLVETELDQAQHDRLSDVLAVAAGRHARAPHALGRARRLRPRPARRPTTASTSASRVRLAGHRVIARARSAGRHRRATVSPAPTARARAGRAARQAERRAAQLHRRMVYAPAFAVVFHWLTLVPLAVPQRSAARAQAARRRSAASFAAAFRTAFGSRIARGPRHLHAAKRVGWAAIAPLRIPFAEVRRAPLAEARGRPGAPAGRAATASTSSPRAAAGSSWSSRCSGSSCSSPARRRSRSPAVGLLPLERQLSASCGPPRLRLARLGLGFVGAADPFAAVLAVLGSITFW